MYRSVKIFLEEVVTGTEFAAQRFYFQWYQALRLERRRPIALDCECFEDQLSDYLDGTLDQFANKELEGHLRFCMHCAETANGMRRIRHTLNHLGADIPSAAFRLRLDCALSQELMHRRLGWTHFVTWSLAIAAALAILFWPEFDESQVEYAQATVPEWSVPVVHRQYGHWETRLPQADASPMYSHAQMRTVSF